MSRNAVAAITVMILVAGCQSKPQHFDEQMGLAKYMYKHKHWDRALQHFGKAVIERPKSYDALVGLGNASLEYGNNLFMDAFTLGNEGKQEYFDIARRGQVKHSEASAAFAMADRYSRGQLAHWYGQGRLHYSRVGNPVLYPDKLPQGLNKDELIAEQMRIDKELRSEIDRGIAAFEKVLAGRDPSPHAQRYLGLLQLRRGTFLLGKLTGAKAPEPEEIEMEQTAKSDLEAARGHLQNYHQVAHMVIVSAVKQPVRTADERKKLRENIEQLHEEMEEITTFLREYKEALDVELGLIATNSTKAKDTERWRNWMTTERLATESYIRSFDEIMKKASEVKNN